MANFGSIAPALFWRAFFVLAVSTRLLIAAPPASAPSGLAQIGKPDAAEAAVFLSSFDGRGLPGSIISNLNCISFPGVATNGCFLVNSGAARNARGTIARIVLTDAQGKEQRLLVQNGAQPAVWSFRDGKLMQPGMTALLEPLVAGVELTAFDLEMPYLAWSDAEVTAIVRVLGRPAHAFLFRPPADFSAQHPEPAAVRAYFDAQFNAPVQTELLDAKGAVTKTLSLVELKRVGDQPLPKILEVRNEITRDKTRFVITAAGLGLDLAMGVFEPSALGDDLRPPTVDRLVRIAP